MSDRPYDSVLLLAYGGPERMEDVRPFLDNVLRGLPVPRERYEAVVHHYELIGGKSPLNELTSRQANGLRSLLKAEGPDLPVHVDAHSGVGTVSVFGRSSSGPGAEVIGDSGPTDPAQPRLAIHAVAGTGHVTVVTEN